ncbi:MAG: hypothetical protein V4596_12560 [Bdellovibrionota bacterium]
MKKILLILLLLAGVNTFAANIDISDYKIIDRSETGVECIDVATEKLRLAQKSKIDLDTMCSDVLFLVEFNSYVKDYVGRVEYHISLYCKERNYSDILAVSLYKTCLQESNLNCVKLKEALDKIKKTKYRTQSFFSDYWSNSAKRNNRCL